MRSPIGVVAVTGPSMLPTLRPGDFLVVRRAAAAAPGRIVVGRFRSRPELLVVKRVVRAEGDGWWLEGDNHDVTDDSRRYGVADIRAVALGRYWPLPPRRLS